MSDQPMTVTESPAPLTYEEIVRGMLTTLQEIRALVNYGATATEALDKIDDFVRSELARWFDEVSRTAAVPVPIASSTTVLADPAPQSSVEIESRAKGAPGVKVKAYRGSDLEDPAARAVEMFDRLTARYAPATE